MKRTDISYTAGIFDGEGCVDIYSAMSNKNSKNLSFMLRVVISQKDGKIMNWLKDRFGGYVRQERKGKFSIYRWDIRSQKAHDFLSLIYPFLIIKKEQVKIALEFDKKKGIYLKSLKGHQGFRVLTENELKWRLDTKNKLKDLKKQFTPYMNSAPTTTERKDF